MTETTDALAQERVAFGESLRPQQRAAYFESTEGRLARAYIAQSELLVTVEAKARAWDDIQSDGYGEKVHDFCRQHNLGPIGANVWYVALDFAEAQSELLAQRTEALRQFEWYSNRGTVGLHGGGGIAGFIPCCVECRGIKPSHWRGKMMATRGHEEWCGVGRALAETGEAS